MDELLRTEYFHNTLGHYLIALCFAVVGISLVKLFKNRFFLKIKTWSASSENTLDDFIVDAVDRLGIPAIYLLLIFIGFNYLTFPPKIEAIIQNAAVVVITYFVVRLIISVIWLFLRAYMHKQEHGEEKIKQLSGLMIIINILVWTLGALFLFDNMGYNVTALITGLGIGGIAVALAAQNILGDLFNYFVIFFDRPFEVGDFINVEDKMGTVEYIGIKTTRLLSLTGEQLIFANTDLTSSRIHNFKRMELRRIEFTLQVVYDVSPEQLREIPGVLRQIVEEHSPVRFDRAHWVSFGQSSLDFVIVYFVLSSEYNVYMDIQQSINQRIFEEFRKRDIGFAYPTTTVKLQNNNIDPTGDAPPNFRAVENR